MGTKKINPWTKNLTPNKSHAEFTSLKNLQKGIKQGWLYFNRRTMWPGYAGTTTNLQIVLNAQKILTKVSYPEKSLDHPHRLKSGDPPPPLHAQMTPSKVPATKPIDSNFPLSILLLSSLRKQLTFGNATTGFPAKWRLRNEHKNPILMTHHYPDLGNASDLFVETSGGVTKCQLFSQATYFCKWCQNVHYSSVATVEWFQCKVFYI